MSIENVYLPFSDSLMLKLDINGSNGHRVHYITSFVTDGRRLYIFDEPSHDPDKFELMLLGQSVTVTSKASGDYATTAVGRLPNEAENLWSRNACTQRFYYDQAIQDLAQLGPIIVLGTEL